MSSTETRRLTDEATAALRSCAAMAVTLSNEELDKPVTFGRQELNVRTILYRMANHAREHTVHVKKLLAETGAPSAHPSEAQLIVELASETLGAFTGLVARMTDDDLDREFEGQTPRKILEHVNSAYSHYQRVLQEAKGS